MQDAQREKAAQFLRLHHDSEILVLLNAWDVASARIIEASGARAVATSSMGVSAALGYPDEQTIPLTEMVDAVGRMAKALRIPLSADMEAGYGSDPAEVVEAIGRIIAVGAIGINIEDGTGDPAAPLIETSRLCERIRAIRAASAEKLHLVINARTDVYLASVGDEGRRLAHTIERGNAYREAGADCVFVPGGLSRETIATLVREIDAPINVVANPAISRPVVPGVPELQDLGVARVSVGSGLMRAALQFTRRAVREVLNKGSYTLMAGELGADDAEESYDMAIGRFTSN